MRGLQLRFLVVKVVATDLQLSAQAHVLILQVGDVVSTVFFQLRRNQQGSRANKRNLLHSYATGQTCLALQLRIALVAIKYLYTTAAAKG